MITIAVKRLVRGLRWSETYGSHPGTAPLLVCVALGAIAGGWLGAIIMLGMFGPLYLLGAWDRGA